jgi:hypothetical protein
VFEVGPSRQTGLNDLKALRVTPGSKFEQVPQGGLDLVELTSRERAEPPGKFTRVEAGESLHVYSRDFREPAWLAERDFAAQASFLVNPGACLGHGLAGRLAGSISAQKPPQSMNPESPAYAVGQAVFIRTDTPDVAEESLTFKSLEELVRICCQCRPNLVLEKVIVFAMPEGEPVALTLGFVAATKGQRPGGNLTVES